MTKWYIPGSKKFLFSFSVVFLVVELLIRIKLGSIYMLSASWLLAHQWFVIETGTMERKNLSEKVMYAIYASFLFCAIIFLVFAFGNAFARTINSEIMFFQLP
jgi:hypothetical protein